MHRPVPSHRAPGGHVPALEAFEPFIERTDSHWWWGGDFKTFNCDNFAVLRAPLAPHNPRNGVYIVVRALWVHANGPDHVGRLVLFNTCGRVPCVNPAHVATEFRASRATLPSDAQMLDGVRVEMVVVNNRVHIAPVDVDHAVCGWRVPQRRLAFAGAVISCPECVSTWRARGYPLQEAL